MENLKKHVVVTGGGSGVGKSIALKLAKEMYQVSIIGRNEKNLINVAKQNPNISWKKCDLTRPENIKECYNEIRNLNGKISIVVANAGIAFSKPFQKIKSEEFKNIIDINLIGVFNSFKYAYDDMASNKWGRMIAISSTAGLKGYSYVSAYSASKHAVIGLTRSLALELVKKNITVNSICPSYVDSPMTDRTVNNIVNITNLSKEDAISEITSSNPQKKLIKPIEIANAVVWLCKETSSSINGHNISISGGEI